MSIDCAFFGFLAADADARTSQAGKPWVRLRISVGKDDAVQWVGVAVFGKAAETAAALKKGDRVYIEGTVKLDTWRGKDGIERHGLNVAAFKLEKTHQIGRDKPKQSGRDRAAASAYAPAAAAQRRDPIKQSAPTRIDPYLDDSIPF
jgi:single-stranded DNA-binding protein